MFTEGLPRDFPELQQICRVFGHSSKPIELLLDNRLGGSTMEALPPILVRIEWADSQGRVTASWLAAHFKFAAFSPEQPIHR